MKRLRFFLLWCSILIPYEKFVSLAVSEHDIEPTLLEAEMQSAGNLTADGLRGRRGVIEEEKHFFRYSGDNIDPHPWLPGSIQNEGDSTTKISITTNTQDSVKEYSTLMRATDKPIGRGARASEQNWIQLPVPDRHEFHGGVIERESQQPRDQRNQRDQRDQRGQRDQRDQRDPRDQRDQRVSRDQNNYLLYPSSTTGDLINSRMPRVNFVTQNKPLDASESRDDRDITHRSSKPNELRQGFIKLEDSKPEVKPVYPRQIIPEYTSAEPRRYFYDNRYYSIPDVFGQDNYYGPIDRKRFVHNTYGPRIDRYDENYINGVLLKKPKPKRMIYYAHLPEIVRTPPSVDLRYRYALDPVSQNMFRRNAGYQGGSRRHAPYRRYIDMVEAGSITSASKADKITVTPILPRKEENVNNGNGDKPIPTNHWQKGSKENLPQQVYLPADFEEIQSNFDNFVQFDEPLLQGPVEQP